jgi:putative hydrolase of the HAD superfamily
MWAFDGDPDVWVFDLDNTLYPASADLFALMDVKMAAYVAQVTGADMGEARRIQKRYFHDHGTTLAGLMASHDIDPHHYLDFVHDIDLDRIALDLDLAAAIAALPGRKLVFTNADSAYGARVLDRLGLGTAFEAIFDIRDADFAPKPDPRAYTKFCDAHHVDPTRAVMVEDMARNLRPAKHLGMGTVWINNGSEQGPAPTDTAFVDHEITALSPWLAAIVKDVHP